MSLARYQQDLWLRLLNVVREGDMRLHQVLTDGRLWDVTETDLIIAFPAGYDWHCETTMKARAVLEDLAARLLGRKLTLNCRVDRRAS